MLEWIAIILVSMGVTAAVSLTVAEVTFRVILYLRYSKETADRVSAHAFIWTLLLMCIATTGLLSVSEVFR